MSLKYVEAAINEFLSSEEAEVLCISGTWGVGKTYEWNRLLNNAASGEDVALDRYAYVSLFGLDCLGDLKSALFENTVSIKKLIEPASEQTYIDGLVRLARPIKSKGLRDLIGRKLLGDEAPELMLSAAFLSVKQQLICIDDLERAGADLEVKDVLGLVSLLKEQRHCKVALLLNREELGKGTTEYQTHLEKVVDISVDFKPTTEEAAAIGLEQECRVSEKMLPYLVALEVTNIRVIRKIHRLAKKVSMILDSFDADVNDQAVATLVLAGWSLFQPKSSVPIEFIRNYDSLRLSLRDEQDDGSELDLRYHKTLSEYGFQDVDDFDQVLIDAMTSGYVIEEKLLASAEVLQSQFRQSFKRSRLHQVWSELYHGSLNTDDDFFIRELKDATMSELTFVSLPNLNSVVKLIREFGDEVDADEIVQAYIDENSDKPISFFNKEANFFLGESEFDEGLLSAMDQKLENYVDDREPLQVLIEIGSKRKWTREDALLLSKLSEEDLVQLFEKLRGIQVEDSIDAILRLARTDKLADQNCLSKKVQLAFGRIASKSPLRARKVKGLNVDLTSVGRS